MSKKRIIIRGIAYLASFFLLFALVVFIMKLGKKNPSGEIPVPLYYLYNTVGESFSVFEFKNEESYKIPESYVVETEAEVNVEARKLIARETVRTLIDSGYACWSNGDINQTEKLGAELKEYIVKRIGADRLEGFKLKEPIRIF